MNWKAIILALFFVGVSAASYADIPTFDEEAEDLMIESRIPN